jgi:hypothetical protein
MFAGQNREQLRRGFVEAWRKFRAGETLEPLDAQIAAVIAEHPEYHGWLESGEAAVGAEFTPERGALNPFLHLGLHLALREQVATDRPVGITDVHTRLARRFGSAHQAEHIMSEILGEVLWKAQRSGGAPDESDYLERLRRLSA